jgi:hypothetical protein
VGNYWDGSSGHGFLFDNGNYTTLDVPGLYRTYDSTFPSGINASRQIVGYSIFDRDIGPGFLLENGSYTRLDGPLITWTEASHDDKGTLIAPAALDESGKPADFSMMAEQMRVTYANAAKILAHFGATLDHVVEETLQPRWRQDFTTDIPADDALSRREFTKFHVLTSGAFVAGQCWIGMMSLLRDSGPMPEKRIAVDADVPGDDGGPQMSQCCKPRCRAVNTFVGYCLAILGLVGDVPDTYRPADFSWHGNHRRKILAKNAEKSQPIREQSPMSQCCKPRCCAFRAKILPP